MAAVIATERRLRTRMPGRELVVQNVVNWRAVRGYGELWRGSTDWIGRPRRSPVGRRERILKTSVIRCHTRRSTVAYLYKHVACSRKSCLVIFDRSARCVAPSRLIRTAIDGGISRISSQSVSDRRRLKIGRCLAIGKAICCPGRTQLHRDLGRASYALRDVGQGGR